MIEYKSTRDKKLSIYKNIFINNDSIIAYYVLYPFNYSTMDSSSAENHVNKLYNVISNLHSALGNIKISIFKLKNIISKEESIRSIVKTVQMYSKDYNDMPEEHKKYIKNITRDFSILAVSIDVKNNFDIENQNLKEIIKTTIDNFVRENFSAKIANVDEEALSRQNVRIKNILIRYAVPANPKLVMNIYINSLFPSYNLIYNDYFVRNSDAILAGVKQDVTPYLGWFEMSNSGISEFGGTARTTYGSVLTILEFPEAINSQNFNISNPGLCVNMNLLSKENAILKFKRMRADVKQEDEEASDAENDDSDINENLTLVQRAIKQILKGRIVAEVDANILVIADTKEELDKKKKYIISLLSDVNIVCSIASNQAKSFVDSFVKHKPKQYFHIMDLQYALSFQLDSGVLVGDQDSKFASPVIGVS